jgi:hypothetical protein
MLVLKGGNYSVFRGPSTDSRHDLVNYNLLPAEPGPLLVLWPPELTVKLLELFHWQAGDSNLPFPPEVALRPGIPLHISRYDARDDEANRRGLGAERSGVNCLVVKGGKGGRGRCRGSLWLGCPACLLAG